MALLCVCLFSYLVFAPILFTAVALTDRHSWPQALGIAALAGTVSFSVFAVGIAPVIVPKEIGQIAATAFGTLQCLSLFWAALLLWSFAVDEFIVSEFPVGSDNFIKATLLTGFMAIFSATIALFTKRIREDAGF